MPSGGPRPGSGPKRSVLHIRLPPLVLAQYEEVARVEDVELVEVVQAALLDWLADWQDAHDALEAIKALDTACE